MPKKKDLVEQLLKSDQLSERDILSLEKDLGILDLGKELQKENSLAKSNLISFIAQQNLAQKLNTLALNTQPINFFSKETLQQTKEIAKHAENLYEFLANQDQEFQAQQSIDALKQQLIKLSQLQNTYKQLATELKSLEKAENKIEEKQQNLLETQAEDLTEHFEQQDKAGNIPDKETLKQRLRDFNPEFAQANNPQSSITLVHKLVVGSKESDNGSGVDQTSITLPSLIAKLQKTSSQFKKAELEKSDIHQQKSKLQQEASKLQKSLADISTNLVNEPNAISQSEQPIYKKILNGMQCWMDPSFSKKAKKGLEEEETSAPSLSRKS